MIIKNTQLAMMIAFVLLLLTGCGGGIATRSNGNIVPTIKTYGGTVTLNINHNKADQTAEKSVDALKANAEVKGNKVANGNVIDPNAVKQAIDPSILDKSIPELQEIEIPTEDIPLSLMEGDVETPKVSE